MSDKTKLEPCPFCGGAAFIRKVGNERSKKRGWDIGCKPCYYNMSQRVLRYDHEWLWPKMVESWNTRAPDQSAQPDEAELVRIVLGMLDMYYRADTRPIWIDTQAADIITALRPYLNDGKRVKELEAALAGVMEDLELRATPYDAGGLKLNCSRSVVRAAYKALKEATP